MSFKPGKQTAINDDGSDDDDISFGGRSQSMDLQENLIKKGRSATETGSGKAKKENPTKKRSYSTSTGKAESDQSSIDNDSDSPQTPVIDGMSMYSEDT